MPRYVINPKSQAAITFGTTEAELDSGTGQDATFQVTSFVIRHAPQKVNVPATFGAGASEDLGKTIYSLELEYLQDWGLNATAFAKYLFDREAQTVWFLIEPAGIPEVDLVSGMKGQCIIPGTDYGGPADETWIATVSCPCVSKPVLVPDTVELAAAAAAGDEDG